MQRTEKGYEISVYSDELTQKGVEKATVKIKNSFPTLEGGFYEVFYDMIKEDGFSDQRLIDSVNHVIRNCVYPQPTIAQFLSFDKKVKLFTFKDMQKMTDTDSTAFETHQAVRIEDLTKPLWAHKSDVERYKMEIWKK